MTLLEVCRQYNAIVKKMRDAAQAEQWDELISLDQSCRPCVRELQSIDQKQFDAMADESVRLLIGEIISYYADISALAQAHRDEIKATLAVDSIAGKLNKLYGF